MTKINVSRLFDAGKALATQAGQELSEMVTFLQTSLEQILRALRNGLTFEDNLYGTVLQLSLAHGQAQKVALGGKSPRHVFVTRVVDATEPNPQIAWYIDGSGNLVIVPYFYTQPNPFTNAGGKSTIASKTLTVEVVVAYA